MNLIPKIKNIVLTIPQVAAIVSKQKDKYFEWARGSGKSTILAFFMRQMVIEMPRASFVLVGSTYSQMLRLTLPTTIKGLEFFGLYQDVDYLVCSSAGKTLGFEMPTQRPNQWNNVIHWSNGTIFQLVSQDGTGRGMNTFGILSDESALLDPDKLYYDVQLTNRAKENRYKKASLLGAEIYMSSTPISKKGKWFTDKEMEALENPDKMYFSKASALSNPYLRPDYYEKAKKNSPSQLLYEAEFLNIRPKEITDGYYANLNPERHYYSDYDNNYLEGMIWLPKEKGFDKPFDSRQDNDVIKTDPLILSFDFGVFNSLVISQQHRARNEYRVLKDFWVKSPKLLDDLIIEQFLPYYSPHTNKTAYVYGGHDGHNRMPNSKRTLYQQIEDILRQHGWKVYIMAKSAAPTHADKYLLNNAILKEHNPKIPRIRINQNNCADLIISLERAEAKEGLKGIEKEKKDERNKSMLQQHTTHLSDAFDAPIYDLYNDIFRGGSILDPSELRIGFS